MHNAAAFSWTDGMVHPDREVKLFLKNPVFVVGGFPQF